MKVSQNTILITGGASGIGLELATQLSPMGNKIIITGRDLTKLKKAQKQLPEVRIVQSDVTDIQSISKLFDQVTQEFPDLNMLINNAGIMKSINLNHTEGSLDELTKEIETNLMGPIRMVKKFLPHLKSKSSAAIMNVSSGLAFVPLPISPVYCASKAGLHSYTQSLRVQLRKTKVKVFELAPPATQTDLLTSDFDSEDMKGITVMSVSEMVSHAIKGMAKDQFEIRPGQSNQLKFMSRLAPEFILNQLSKPVDRMLASK